MLALVVTFNLDGLPDEDFRSVCKQQWLTPIAPTSGLVAKIWLADQPGNTYGSIYLWENRRRSRTFRPRTSSRPSRPTQESPISTRTSSK